MYELFLSSGKTGHGFHETAPKAGEKLLQYINTVLALGDEKIRILFIGDQSISLEFLPIPLRPHSLAPR